MVESEEERELSRFTREKGSAEERKREMKGGDMVESEEERELSRFTREKGSAEERKEEGTKAEDGSKPSWACMVGFLDGQDQARSVVFIRPAQSKTRPSTAFARVTLFVTNSNY